MNAWEIFYLVTIRGVTRVQGTAHALHAKDSRFSCKHLQENTVRSSLKTEDIMPIDHSNLTDGDSAPVSTGFSGNLYFFKGMDV